MKKNVNSSLAMFIILAAVAISSYFYWAETNKIKVTLGEIQDELINDKSCNFGAISAAKAATTQPAVSTQQPSAKIPPKK